jgi:acetylornithine deacetylase
MPQEDVKDVERQVTDHIMAAVEKDSWLRRNPPAIEFKEVGADGAEIASDHPIVQTLSTAFESVTGSTPVISGRTGGADTRYLIKYGQTPTVIFGPGMTSEMHAMNESVPIANLYTVTETLALAIADWCGIE